MSLPAFTSACQFCFPNINSLPHHPCSSQMLYTHDYFKTGFPITKPPRKLQRWVPQNCMGQGLFICLSVQLNNLAQRKSWETSPHSVRGPWEELAK